MKIDYNKYQHLTFYDMIEAFDDYIEKQKGNDIREKLHLYFYGNKINYPEMIKLIPELDEDTISSLLKYDRDLSIIFLLAIAPYADSEDITQQAIYLLNRHGLNYIKPLIKYCDEDDIREALNK